MYKILTPILFTLLLALLAAPGYARDRTARTDNPPAEGLVFFR